MHLKRAAVCLFIGLTLFVSNVSGQSQKVADSLTRIYKEDILRDTSRLELLRNLSFNEVKNLRLAQQYADELIKFSSLSENNLYIHRGYFQKGNIRVLLGDLEEALDSYFKSISAARKAGYLMGEANAFGAIAGIYGSINNHRNAMLYYNKAISTLRESNDSVALASAILNLGDEYLNCGKYDSALLSLNESQQIFENVNYRIGKAYSLGNIGMVYAKTGRDAEATLKINEAIQILEELGDYSPVCVYLISMCDIHDQKGDHPGALRFALRSLELANHYGLKEQISESSLKLSELYERSGEMANALKYYKNYILFKDSVNNVEVVQKMADLRTDYEVSQKQLELVKKEKLLANEKWTRNAFLIGFIMMVLVALISYRSSRILKIKNQKIREQKAEIEKNNEDLIELNEEKNSLIGIVAHDLKSPINQVRGMLSVVKMEYKADQSLVQYVEMMEQSSQRLNEMITKILNVEGIESKQLNIKLEKFNFSELVRMTIKRAELEAKRKQIHLHYSTQDNVFIYADSSYTYQVIDNLLSNAIKFSLPEKSIFINVTLHNTVALFEIQDQGPGISESDKKKLFKKYQKLSAIPTANESSTGLGLSIVKKYVDAMHGEIWCESEAGKGASFFVKFNLKD